MKPINAENPITAADVGRLAVRRDGARVKVSSMTSAGPDARTFNVCGVEYQSSGVRRWRDEAGPLDLIGWAEETPAPSPLTVDLIVRVPLAQVSEFVSENEVVGKHEGVK